ncbi:MAG TPA: Ig-like domain-containing protein, partial [Bacteroidota bacterium]|nr:Ig-like domain-containing protein [Bacteroidota bacterium]
MAINKTRLLLPFLVAALSSNTFGQYSGGHGDGFAAARSSSGWATSISLTSGNSQSKTINSALDSAFVVTLLDGASVPVCGDTVFFAIVSVPSGASGQSLSVAAAVSDSSGHARTILMLGNKIGSYSVTATRAGLSGSPVTFTATATVGPLNHFAVSGIGSPQTAGSPFDVTLTAQDTGSNTVTGFSGTVNLTTTAGTITPSTSANFSNGSLTQSVTVTQAGAGKTITADDGSGHTGTSGTFTVNPGSFSLVQSTVAVGRSSISSGDTTRVCLIAKDSLGNRLTSGGLTVAFGLGSGTSAGTFGTVVDSTNGKYVAIFTGTTSGTARTITATIG